MNLTCSTFDKYAVFCTLMKTAKLLLFLAIYPDFKWEQLEPMSYASVSAREAREDKGKNPVPCGNRDNSQKGEWNQFG